MIFFGAIFTQINDDASIPVLSSPPPSVRAGPSPVVLASLRRPYTRKAPNTTLPMSLTPDLACSPPPHSRSDATTGSRASSPASPRRDEGDRSQDAELTGQQRPRDDVAAPSWWRERPPGAAGEEGGVAARPGER